jgi:hypothetical protein
VEARPPKAALGATTVAHSAVHRAWVDPGGSRIGASYCGLLAGRGYQLSASG